MKRQRDLGPVNLSAILWVYGLLHFYAVNIILRRLKDVSLLKLLLKIHDMVNRPNSASFVADMILYALASY